MYVQCVAELVGTFVFLSVILSQGQPIPIAVALLAVIYLAGGVSGGHFNPAVTFMMSLKDPNFQYLAPYIISQLAGAAGALYVYQTFIQKPQ